MDTAQCQEREPTHMPTALRITSRLRVTPLLDIMPPGCLPSVFILADCMELSCQHRLAALVPMLPLLPASRRNKLLVVIVPDVATTSRKRGLMNVCTPMLN